MAAFLTILTGVAAWFFDTWIMMISVGVVHGSWCPLIPPMGFGAALALSALAFLGLFPAFVLGALLKD